MFDDFQLVAIVRNGAERLCLSIPLHQELQDQLNANWYEQYLALVGGHEQIEFDPAYQIGDDEAWRISDYQLPEWIEGLTRERVGDLPSVGRGDPGVEERIKAVAALALRGRQELLLFQSFTPSHVIRPGRFLFLRHDTYHTSNHPGLALSDRLTAVYERRPRRLVFESFSRTNAFLSLADYFREASEEGIREILGHARLAPESIDALAVRPSLWFRRRFALLGASGVLDRFTAHQIRNRSEGFPVTVVVTGNRVVFPANKRDAKRLLQFLNEELFRGAITEDLYETNSKRPAQ